MKRQCIGSINELSLCPPSIQKLSFEEQKYELAKVMGSDFAPKVLFIYVQQKILQNSSHF